MLLEAETNKYCPGGYDICAISNLITWVLNFFLSVQQLLASVFPKEKVLLEYQYMPSLSDVAHDGVLCTFNNRSAPDRDKWCGPSGQAAWTVHHMKNDTLVGHSPPASQAGRRVGPAL